ncbi:hypothetical protein HPB47_011753 [Ixodes persulcatus]|uniref:Uncharacterized protein n=1 Tax=Ixodes persulcatus TaxID=34615 RepID=A0AC60NVF6_IXOPE|nr:hypothetical protein HPB47_011753 [Ixodes persulcatus]
MSASTKKRKVLNLEDEVAVLDAVTAGEKKDVAARFGILASSLSTILNVKDAIRRAVEAGTSGKKKKLKRSTYADVDKAVFTRFMDMRARNVPISGAFLQQKAKDYACILGCDDLMASNGWLQSFKNRSAMETDKKRQQNTLLLATKVKIIQELDRNQLTKTEIAKKFGVPKSMLSRILKNKRKIEYAVKLGSFMTDHMWMRTTAYSKIEDVLLLWFKRARSANLPINGPLLEEKAREISSQMGIENFRWMLLCADNERDYSVDLLSALDILTHAWEQVKVSTVQGCFHNARCSRQEAIPDEEDDAAAANTLFSQVIQPTSLTRDGYETLDANIATCREESLEEMIAEVRDEDQSSEDDIKCDPEPVSAPDCAARDAVTL